MNRLADLVVRAPWRVLLAVVGFAAVAGVLGGPVAGVLIGGGFVPPRSEAQRAVDRLEAATGRHSTPVVVLVGIPEGPASPASQARVQAVRLKLLGDTDVVAVAGFYDTGSAAFLSRDGRQTYLVAYLRRDLAGAGASAEAIRQRLAGEHDVLVGGADLAQYQVEEQVRKDLGAAELLAFPVLFVLALWVFRSPIAALLPLGVGGITILGSFLGLRAVSLETQLSVFALNLVTGMGLGLAIDYSLFIVSRFREELAAGHDVDQAVRRTVASAGRTVLFSCLTVAAAVGSLAIFPERFLYSMGYGGVITALVGGAVALVGLPAVLRLLGRRVDALAPRRWRRPLEVERTFWGWAAAVVVRRPVLFAIAGTAVLLALGAPFLTIKFTSVDQSVLPATYSARQVSDRLDRDFSDGGGAPVFVLAPHASATAAGDMAERLRRLDGVTRVDVRPAGDAAYRLDLTTRWGAFDGRTQDVVSGARSIAHAQGGLVGGEAAGFGDLQANLLGLLPWAVLIVAGATMVVLFLMTGSAVLPLKAVAMNVLTLSGVFGVLVWIFQQGHLTRLLDFRSQGALESTQPVLIFALVFGLSTDYGVFLLSRIKELRDGGAGNRQAVAGGLGRTGRIVSAAALLFCVAIGAFATSQIVFIKELGLGTALGVVIDATLVRGVLVPALMGLLGDWNWWAPAPLRRLHGWVGLSETGAGPAAAAASTGAARATGAA